MNIDNSTLVIPSQEPVKMPRRDFFLLPETFRAVVEGRLMVLANNRGGQAFVPVRLI